MWGNFLFFQQLLVQAEVHPHHPYVNIPETKPLNTSSPPADSPPNTATSVSAHTNNTSPSLAEATVSDNESFTLHSSGLPTPDTPLLMYTPLLDDETCSTSTSAANTPDFEHKLTPSPATPGSAKYHRLGAPSLSPSPTPTPRLTPNLDGENSYENMLAQATQFGGTRYENVPGSSSLNLNTSDSSGCISKYMNIMQTEDKPVDSCASPVLKESHVTIKYENIVSLPETQNTDVYEPVVSESEHGVVYEPVEILGQRESCAGSGCEVQRVYQNVPNTHGEEDHLYEDVQVREKYLICLKNVYVVK